MLLITCQVNLILTWSADFVISSATGAKTFGIVISLVILPTQKMLLPKLESGFKGTINWNKYQSKEISLFEYNGDRKAQRGYFLPKVETKGYNNPKAMEEFNFTGDIGQGRNAKIFFIFEQVKETVLIFLQGPWENCNFILLWCKILCNIFYSRWLTKLFYISIIS